MLTAIGPTAPMSFKFQDPVLQPGPKKARTLREKDWVPHKERIRDLYIARKKTLKEVRSILELDCDFRVTDRQLRSQIKKWGFGKNVKDREMKEIVERYDGNSQQVRNVDVSSGKIERYMRDHGLSHALIRQASSVNLGSGGAEPPTSIVHTLVLRPATHLSEDQYGFSEYHSPLEDPFGERYVGVNCIRWIVPWTPQYLQQVQHAQHSSLSSERAMQTEQQYINPMQLMALMTSAASPRLTETELRVRGMREELYLLRMATTGWAYHHRMHTMLSLARHYSEVEHRHDLSVDIFARMLATYRAHPPALPLMYKHVLWKLADALFEMRRLDEAQGVLTQAHAWGNCGQAKPLSNFCANIYLWEVTAKVLYHTGHMAEAFTRIKQVIKRCSKVLGRSHFATLGAMETAMDFLVLQKRYDEAERLWRRYWPLRQEESLRPWREQHSGDGMSLQGWEYLPRILRLAGKHAQLILEVEPMASRFEAKFGRRHSRTRFLYTNLMEALITEGQVERAEVIALSNIQTAEFDLEQGASDTSAEARRALLRIYTDQERWDEARHIAEVIQPEYMKYPAGRYDLVRGQQLNLFPVRDLYQIMGDHVALAKTLQEMINIVEGESGAYNPKVMYKHTDLVEALNKAGFHARAHKVRKALLTCIRNRNDFEGTRCLGALDTIIEQYEGLPQDSYMDVDMPLAAQCVRLAMKFYHDCPGDQIWGLERLYFLNYRTRNYIEAEKVARERLPICVKYEGYKSVTLRAATDLSRALAVQGQVSAAHQHLRNFVQQHCSDYLETNASLKAAREALQTWKTRLPTAKL